MVDVKQPTATFIYAKWLTWTVRAGLVLLVIAFVADLAGFMREIPLDRMPQIWSNPAPKHAAGVSSVVLAAIAWLASCYVVCLVPLLPKLRRDRESALAVMCLLQIVIVALAAIGGTLAR